MEEERQVIDRIDIGCDSILIYRFGGQSSLVVSLEKGGAVEIFLDSDESLRLAEALRLAAIERD